LIVKEQDQLAEYPDIPNLLKSLVDKWVQEDCAPTDINHVDDIKAFISSVKGKNHLAVLFLFLFINIHIR
jgi:hypothetical protein